MPMPRLGRSHFKGAVQFQNCAVIKERLSQTLKRGLGRVAKVPDPKAD